MSGILLTGLEKWFPGEKKPALRDLSFHIPKGKIVAVAGPDGSGKTTLMRLLAGLMEPTKGTIAIDGLDPLRDSDALHKNVGYMPQRFGLYEDLSVIQNLELYAGLKGIESKGELFQQLLTFTGLSPFVDRLAGALSGGMKQKLGLACALAGNPQFLILDEPSVGVDPLSRRELWKMVEALIAKEVTVVWSTTYLNEVERCSQVILLNEGNLLFYGPPEEMTRSVEGRVFTIGGFQGSKRALLTEVLKEESVLDASVEGDLLRVLLKSKEGNVSRFGAQTPVAARFEDAFLDKLGGVPKVASSLADFFGSEGNGKVAPVKAIELTKRFGEFTAVGDVSFEVKRGEIFGIIGPNGAGKSTTFKMLCGLLKATSGEAYVEGVDLRSAPGIARSHIGYMAQKFSLYGHLNVLQNLHFFAGIYNLDEEEKTIARMIELFGLQPYLEQSTDLLSLGFKQRLALACALMHHPEILFLDEPTSGVDPITRREFWKHINNLSSKGVTVVITTHYMDEAEYCDRIALVYQSRLVRIATPDELKVNGKTIEDVFIDLCQND